MVKQKQEVPSEPSWFCWRRITGLQGVSRFKSARARAASELCPTPQASPTFAEEKQVPSLGSCSCSGSCWCCSSCFSQGPLSRSWRPLRIYGAEYSLVRFVLAFIWLFHWASFRFNPWVSAPFPDPPDWLGRGHRVVEQRFGPGYGLNIGKSATSSVTGKDSRSRGAWLHRAGLSLSAFSPHLFL